MRFFRRRMVVILLLGIGLIAAAWGYIELFMLRPIGSGPAGPSIAAEPFQQPWSDRQVRLIGLGDSITAGLGADTPSHSFFNRLIQNPDDEFADMQGRCLSRVLPHLKHENLAISGSNSIEHLNLIRSRLTPAGEDEYGIVVFTTGGNDLIHSYGRAPPREGAMYGATLAQAEPWIAAFETRVNAMLDHITAAFPGGCEIYLADIYDPTDGVGDAPSIYLDPWPDGLAIHARYNEILHRIAASRDNVFLVPLHATFLGHGAHCRQFWRPHYRAQDPHYWFFANIEDPNDRGYDAIRRVFLQAIMEHTSLRQEASQVNVDDPPDLSTGPIDPEPQEANVDELLLFYPARFPEGDWQPDNLDFQDVWFTAADGTRLHAWYCPGDRGRATILMAHGNGGHLAHRAPLLRWLQRELRVNTMIFDYRGYGRSEGKPSVRGILLDLQAAREQLVSLSGISLDQQILMGESLGGAVVIQSAAQQPAKALILQSTFSSLREVASIHFPRLAWLVSRDKLNSVAAMARIDCPILQSHGDNDTTVPIGLAQTLFQAARGSKTFVTVAGAGHNDWLTPEYLRALRTFIASYHLSER